MRTTIIAANAVAFSFLAAPAASAANGELLDMNICNNYPHTIFVAIAYPEENETWITRGWLQVETGACGTFDTDLRVKAFFIRAETEEFYYNRRKNERQVWGNGGRSFDVDANIRGTFNFWQAEKRFVGTTTRTFFQFLGSVNYTSDVDSVATETFNADGSATGSASPVRSP